MILGQLCPWDTLQPTPYEYQSIVLTKTSFFVANKSWLQIILFLKHIDMKSVLARIKRKNGAQNYSKWYQETIPMCWLPVNN